MKSFPMPSHEINVIPRKQQFNFEGLPKHWHGDNAATTHLYNATSFGITVLEDIFIRLSRELLDDIRNPSVKKELRGFIGQEAHHSHSHHAFNDFLKSHGYDVDTYERFIDMLFGTLDKHTSVQTRLELCVAAEHYTAMFAHYGLKYRDELFKEAPAEIARLFEWHGLEELEHKAVLYNLYLSIFGKDNQETVNTYLTRTGVFLVSTLLIGFYYGVAIPSLMLKDKKLFSVKDWFGFGKQFFVKPGIFFKGIPFYLSYFKFGFHPWQHDDSAMAKELLEQVIDAEKFQAVHLALVEKAA